MKFRGMHCALWFLVPTLVATIGVAVVNTVAAIARFDDDPIRPLPYAQFGGCVAFGAVVWVMGALRARGRR